MSNQSNSPYYNPPNLANQPPPNPYQQQQAYQNQGFQPYQNQGFQPNNQYPYIQAGGLACPICRRQTQSFPKKSAGGATWIWCFALFIFTGICCCIPFCVQSCQDTLIICTVCQAVKGRIEANCC